MISLSFLAQLGDDVALGPFRRVFLPEGLAAGLILAKLRIGVPVDDGAVRLGDDMGGDPLAVRPPIIPFLRGMTAPDVYA